MGIRQGEAMISRHSPPCEFRLPLDWGGENSEVIQIEDEMISYASKTATAFNGCTRGEYGTTAAGHASGVAVKIVKKDNNFGLSAPTDEVEEAGLNLEWVQ